MDEAETDDDDILKSFYRQSEALEFFRSKKSNNLFVFSWEVGLGGQRKFMVTTLNRFWSFYQGMSKRNYYEVIVDKCKLYMDLEFKWIGNEHKDGYSMTKALIKKTNDLLLQAYNVRNSIEDILILESSNSEKFSLHLVFLNIVMENNVECGHFVRQLLNSFSGEEEEFFQVACKGSKKVWFLDSSVYSRLRNFRLYNSTKLGKKTPFTVSKLNQSSKKSSSEFCIFKSSIVSNIQENSSLIRCPSPTLTRPSVSPVNSSQFPSPYNEIDDFLSTLIKSAGGRLSSWKYVINDKNYVYNTVGYRFCSNVDRKHSRSNVFFVFNVGAGIIRQGCYKCTNFYSSSTNVKHLLPWLYGEESWEDW